MNLLKCYLDIIKQIKQGRYKKYTKQFFLLNMLQENLLNKGLTFCRSRRGTNKSPSSNSIFKSFKFAAFTHGHFYFLSGTYVTESFLLCVICGEYCYALRAFQGTSIFNNSDNINKEELRNISVSWSVSPISSTILLWFHHDSPMFLLWFPRCFSGFLVGSQ